MKVTILSSGSKGNSTLIETSRHNILIDAGLPLSNLEKRLNKPFPEIDILIITHSHNDHIKGIKSVIKKYNPLIITKSKEVLELLLDNNKIIENINIDDLNIELFPLSHDVECYGVEIKENKKELVYITDTGYINEKILSIINDKDMYIIESNHDITMLRNGPYCEYLKKRVWSDSGHLSNEQTSKYLSAIVGKNTKYIVLAHLSHENNTEEKALQETKKEIKDKKILVAKQEEALETIEV